MRILLKVQFSAAMSALDAHFSANKYRLDWGGVNAYAKPGVPQPKKPSARSIFYVVFGADDINRTDTRQLREGLGKFLNFRSIDESDIEALVENLAILARH